MAMFFAAIVACVQASKHALNLRAASFFGMLRIQRCPRVFWSVFLCLFRDDSRRKVPPDKERRKDRQQRTKLHILGDTHRCVCVCLSCFHVGKSTWQSRNSSHKDKTNSVVPTWTLPMWGESDSIVYLHHYCRLPSTVCQSCVYGSILIVCSIPFGSELKVGLCCSTLGYSYGFMYDELGERWLL